MAAPVTMLMTKAAGPRCHAPQMVKGGTIIDRSLAKARKGVGELAVSTPSIAPRTGSRSVETQRATSTPGMPTARNAACQPASPIGAPTG